jgi:hypothetical protein
MLTRVVSGKFRMMRVGFCTGIHPRLREAEEGILPLGEENVLDERENCFRCNNVLSFEAPSGFTFL